LQLLPAEPLAASLYAEPVMNELSVRQHTYPGSPVNEILSLRRALCGADGMPSVYGRWRLGRVPRVKGYSVPRLGRAHPSRNADTSVSGECITLPSSRFPAPPGSALMTNALYGSAGGQLDGESSSPKYWHVASKKKVQEFLPFRRGQPLLRGCVALCPAARIALAVQPLLRCLPVHLSLYP
jgi:hypothetical protein